jgi:hypothetical protein
MRLFRQRPRPDEPSESFDAAHWRVQWSRHIGTCPVCNPNQVSCTAGREIAEAYARAREVHSYVRADEIVSGRRRGGYD